MNSRREFLKGAAFAGASALAYGALGDQVTEKFVGTLPEGSIGDPQNPSFGRHIFPLNPSMTDGPSAFLKDGKVIQPQREVPVFHTADVVVVGGGPAGFSAAVAAAKTGAKVALVERYGSLGGLFSNGMVLIMLATVQTVGLEKFRFVTKGVCQEFIDRLNAIGPHVITQPKGPESFYEPTVDAEAAKYVMDRMVADSKIDMFFHCWGVDVIQEGNALKGVIFESKEGRQAILAKQVVDCTGDGDIFFNAGADYRQITHALGFVVQLGNMDRIAPDAKAPANPKTVGPWPTRSNEPNKALCWTGNRGPTGNAVSVRDLTAAEIEHRKNWFEHVEEMRRTPGWEQVYLANTTSQLGPRGSRLLGSVTIVDRKLIKEKGGRFEHAVGYCGFDAACGREAFQIPYEALLPKKVDNLLAAGRCIGAPDTIDTFRLISPCFVEGQAAGVAAALSAKLGISPRELDYGVLRGALVKQGVCLD